MIVRFRCPKCSTAVQAGEEERGEPVPCPGCGVRLRVPGVKPPELEPESDPEPDPEPEPRRRKRRRRRTSDSLSGAGGFLATSAIRWIVGVALSTVLGAVFCCGWLGWVWFGHHGADLSEEPIPAVTVSAADLARAFANNDAEGKYTDEDVEVTGVVQQLTVERGVTVVVLQGAEAQGITVRCLFGDPDGDGADPEEAAKVAGLRNGQQVTIEGYCAGKQAGAVRLLDCVLVRPMR